MRATMHVQRRIPTPIKEFYQRCVPVSNVESQASLKSLEASLESSLKSLRSSRKSFRSGCNSWLKPRLHDTTGCQTRCQSGCTTRFDNWLNEQLFVQHGCQTRYGFDIRFDNRLYRVYKHSTGCKTVFIKPVIQPGLTTGWTNSCSLNTVVKPVVKPVWQPVWQPVGCLFTRYSRLSNKTGLTTGCIE